MAALPNLGAIVHFGVGYDTTDVARATELGIGVSNTPDVLTDCVADTAVGLLLDTMRGLSAADRFCPRRALAPGGQRSGFLTRKVLGTDVGILGLGRIGSAIAHRPDAFRLPHRLSQSPPRGRPPCSYAASPPSSPRR